MKKESLTLSQLANYDDLLTDALVDRVYFWGIIRKNRGHYAACRGMREEEITDVIRSAVVIGKDPVQACTQLLELHGFKRFNERLSVDEREHFQRHLRKYVSIYLPDCPFEVVLTNRYTIDMHEAAVVARRVIHKGELIKYLSGIQVPITREEEKDLDLTRRDFSIVMSSRKKRPSLFLGPARFANHDCNANARLTTKGSNGMTVVAVREITVGSEITVSYGDDYFGINNCECLCGTCEDLLRNGWASSLATSIEEVDQKPDDVLAVEGYGLRRISGTFSSTVESSRTVTPSAGSPKSRKRKFNERGHAESYISGAHANKQGNLKTFNKPTFPSGLSHQFSVEVERPSWSPLQRDTNSPGRSTTPTSNTEDSQRASSAPYASTAATSLSEHTPAPKDGAIEEVLQLSFIPQHLVNLHETDTTVEVELTATPEALPTTAAAMDSGSELSDLPDDCVIDDTLKQVVIVKDYKRRVTRRLMAQLPRKEQSMLLFADDRTPTPTSVQVSENLRKPGDYIRSSRLLASQHSSWIECRLCPEYFVQSDNYLKKWSCPRCERHSKLYGYQWPKTDKSGKLDTEERILDHRTINWHVYAEEEKDIRKGGKSLITAGQELATETEQESSTDEPRTPKPRKRRRVQKAATRVSSGLPAISRKPQATASVTPTNTKRTKTIGTVYELTDTPYTFTPQSSTRIKPTQRATPTKCSDAKRSPVKEVVAIKRKVSPSTPKEASRVAASRDTLYRVSHKSPASSNDASPELVGQLKRPTRKASMGVKAAVAAAADSGDEEELLQSVKKKKSIKSRDE